MKPITTATHGVLDYLFAAALFTVPRFTHWGGYATGFMTVLAVATLVYSLVTRYELGAFKWLPMNGHLALDLLSGLALVLAPFFVRFAAVPGVMIGMGIFEILVVMLSQSRPVAQHAVEHDKQTTETRKAA